MELDDRDVHILDDTAPGLVPARCNPGRLTGLVDHRYEVLSPIEGGGMSFVYKARDVSTNRVVVLKTWALMDDKGEYRLKTEFRRARPVRHENLVELLHLGRDAERELLYFTMEYIDGVDFISHVSRASARAGELRADLRRLREATRQLVRGTIALHRRNILHRDLKPSNVLVARAGRVVILDFGLADALNRRTETLRTTTNIEGTACYMAPEQAVGGHLSPAADWYAVGVILFECVTGCVPFDGEWLDVLVSKRDREAPRMSELVRGVPAELDELVAQLLLRNPEERASSAHLLAWCEGRRSSCTSSRLPSSTNSVPDIALASRRGPQEAIRLASERVRRLRPTALFIHGPTGAGKSAMIELALRELEAGPAPFAVIRGGCEKYETVPFRAFDRMIDGLTRFLRGLSPVERGFLSGLPVPHLLRVFPVLARAPGLDLNAPHNALAGELLLDEHMVNAAREFQHLLFEIARRFALAIHLDNLELGERDSVPFLNALLGERGRPPLLLIGSYRHHSERSAMVEAVESHIARPRENWILGIEIGPLPQSDMIKLAQGHLVNTAFAGRGFATTLAASCDGNAFLLEQLARLVRRYQQELSPSGETGGAEVLDWATVAAAALRALSPNGRALLEVLAVNGAAASLNLLASVAGVQGHAHEALKSLRRSAVIETRDVGGRIIVELLDKRLYGATLAQICEERRDALLRRLAQIHLNHADGRVERGAELLATLGETKRAAECVANAGYRATITLAFARAATLYAKAVHYTPDDRALRGRLAVALAQAGRPHEAGLQFLTVARGADSAKRVELTARGVEQLIYAGHLEIASRTIRALLVDFGVEYPETAERVVELLTIDLRRLAAHSLRYQEHSPCELHGPNRAEFEAYIRIGKALLPVDPNLGGYLLVRGTQLALLAGAPRSVAKGLAFVGILVSGDDPNLANRLLDRADRVASTICDRYAQGLARLARGVLAYREASWLEALGHYDIAEELLRRTYEESTRWDLSMVCAGQRATQAAMADIPVLNHGPALAPIGLTAYDRARHCIANTLRALAADRPDQAAVYLQSLPRAEETLGLEHAIAGALSLTCELYTGRVRRSGSVLAEILDRFSEQSLRGINDYRVDVTMIRVLLGRVALVHAVYEDEERPQLAELVRAIVRALEGADSVALHGEAKWLRAGLALVEQERLDAIMYFRAAAQNFLAAGMELHLACTWRALGTLLGDHEGKLIQARSDTLFAREGVRNPRRWTRLHIPTLGFFQCGRP